MFRSRLSVLGMVVSVLVLAGSVGAAVHQVTVRNFEFDPVNVVVAPGDTVQWIWESGSHTVTSGDPPCVPDGLYFDEPINSGSPTYSYVVPMGAPSSIPYFCIPHCPLMAGTITVQAPVPAASTWGLVVLALLLATAATIVLGRPRTSAAAAAI